MIHLKNSDEIKIMREGGKILGSVRDRLAREAKEGVSLKKLDRLAEKLMKKSGGLPAFLNYRPHDANRAYPASICASLNEVVVHGVPTNYELKSGDLLKIDLGLFFKGFYTDTAITIGVGKISVETEKLIAVTKKSLELAIESCRLGNNLGDVGATINKYVKSQGFKIIKGLSGHGIGKKLHEEPTVCNDSHLGSGPKLVSGMVLAIEPMVSLGSPYIKQLRDESYATIDGSLSAQFENTIAITENGPEILTE